ARQRAVTLREELAAAMKTAERRGALGTLVAALRTALGVLDEQLRSNVDNLELRNAVTEAERGLRMFDEWISTGEVRVPPSRTATVTPTSQAATTAPPGRLGAPAQRLANVPLAVIPVGPAGGEADRRAYERIHAPPGLMVPVRLTDEQKVVQFYLRDISC